MARGLAGYQGLYGEFLSKSVEPSGEYIADAGHNVKLMTDQVSSFVRAAAAAFQAERFKRAMGADGGPGDEALIREVVNELVTAYAQMIAWGIRARNANVDPAWRPPYLALSKTVSLPLHQYQDYSAALSATVGRVVADRRAGKAPTEKIELALLLSIDPNAMAEFNVALEALKKTK